MTSPRFCLLLIALACGGCGDDDGPLDSGGDDAGRRDAGSPVDAAPLPVDAPDGSRRDASTDGGGRDDPDAGSSPETLVTLGLAGPSYAGGALATFRLEASGSLTQVDRVEIPAGPCGNFPSFAATHGARLFSVREVWCGQGLLVSYALDGLTELDRANTDGGPAHVAVATDGSAVFTANFGGGSVQAFPVDAAGQLAEPSRIETGDNPHQVVVVGRDLYVPCLGSDRVDHLRWEDGALASGSDGFHAAEGAGPRHLVVTSDGTRAYLLNERDSTLVSLARDTDTGALTQVGEVAPTLPDGMLPDAHRASELLLDPSETWLFAGNRGYAGDDPTFDGGADDSVARLRIVDGVARFEDAFQTGGDNPRSMSLAPDGRSLLVGNQSSNTVRIFAVGDAVREITTVDLGDEAPYFVGAFGR